MRNEKKIIILDFSTSQTHVFPYDENLYENVSDFFDSVICDELGIRETNCQYMVVDKLVIHMH